ncbi:MAG: polymerase sigma factor, sigma-70 family [Thermoleophilia bacterium]|nr:polymerase sigma factor, sigma-70 family [Thermoleophilia bacterium]
MCVRALREGRRVGSSAAEIWPCGNRRRGNCERAGVISLASSVGTLPVMPDASREQLDQAALVTRVATGDERALALLHEALQRVALATAHRIVRDAGAAHEVAQDAFLDLWRTAASYDPDRSSVIAWLLRLVRLRAIDRLRRDGAERRGGRATTGSLDDALEASTGYDVATDVQERVRAVRIRSALDALPPDQRRVVELAFLEGHTHAELAELLDLPAGTVKTRCFRGLAKLAELLADEREGDPR